MNIALKSWPALQKNMEFIVSDISNSTDIEAAIRREKRLKKWNRAWKIRLIEEANANWDDLYPQIAAP
jgi:predicted GIY-YIG superfamily endonuclease